ncbi:MAG: hypothetical protein Q9216_006763 [Gyalolechia sp. 2 TL-2023]
MRLTGMTESSEPQNLNKIVQHSDPVTVIEIRLEAIDLNAVDDNTIGCTVNNAPKPDSSDTSLFSCSSTPMDQFATKDEIACIRKGIQSDRKLNQSNVTRLLYLADTIGKIVHDKAIDLNEVQHIIDEHDDKLDAVSNRISELEPPQSKTNTSTTTPNQPPQALQKIFARQIQRMRRGIEAIKTRALVETRGTKRKFDQMSDKVGQIDRQRSNTDTRTVTDSTQGPTSDQGKMKIDIRNIQSDQTEMNAKWKQGWVVAGERIADFVIHQMDQFRGEYECDKQSVERFFQEYRIDKEAIERFHREYIADQKSLGADLTSVREQTKKVAAATDRLEHQLQAEVREAVREGGTSSRQQSNSGVSHQLTTDVPVAHVEEQQMQGRHELGTNQVGPSSNVHDQTSPTHGTPTRQHLQQPRSLYFRTSTSLLLPTWTKTNGDVKPVERTPDSEDVKRVSKVVVAPALRSDARTR